jgi:hypothetical protein
VALRSLSIQDAAAPRSKTAGASPPSIALEGMQPVQSGFRNRRKTAEKHRAKMRPVTATLAKPKPPVPISFIYSCKEPTILRSGVDKTVELLFLIMKF